MRILIVDDDLVDRKSLRRALNKEVSTCVAVEVETVDENLLALIRQQQFDIVFLDYNLPQRTGLELLIELQGDACFENTAFIMISTNEEQSLSQACKDAGALDYLAKTELTPAILKQAISKAQAALAAKQ